MLERVLAALQAPDLLAEADGSCRFVAQDLWVTLIACAPDAFVMRTHLGPIEPQATQALEQLLAANLFPYGVGGAIVGLDAQAHVYVTQRFRLDGWAIPALRAALDRFVLHAKRCQGLMTVSPTAPLLHHELA